MLVLKPAAVAFAAAIFVSSATGSAVQAADPLIKVWERHPGSNRGDSVWAVTTDAAANAIVAGDTLGSIGKLNAGREDAFLIKYSPTGTVLWRRQLGTQNIDRARAVATDGSGNIAVVGYTSGWLFGRNSGGWDGYVVSYAPDGARRWAHQLGTAEFDSMDGVVALAAGDVFIGGTLGSDCLLIRYDRDGRETWRRVVRSGRTGISGIVQAPSGNIVVFGATFGATTEQDVYLASYSPDGNQQWFQQFGTAGTDYTGGVAAAAAGTIYVVGSQLGSEARKGFLAAFSPAGVQQWKRTFGADTDTDVTGLGVAVDAAGNVVITAQQGQQFVASYTASGTLQWTHTLATMGDYPLFPAFDAAGNLLLAGSIRASDARGYFDGYLAKFTE